LRSGSERMRLPVILKMALHTAGAIGGTPGSPMPPLLAAGERQVRLHLGHGVEPVLLALQRA
jgi:hypothetical protein